MKKAKCKIVIIVLVSWGFVWSRGFHVQQDQVKQENVSLPIKVELTDKKGFASFTSQHHPGNRIGYRFFEHTPLVFGSAPKTDEESKIVAKQREKMVQELSARQGVVVYHLKIEDTNHWVDQIWTFYMAPAEDGIDLLWVIATKENGLPQYYGVQQCFRMSGKSNAEWRRAIAETPAFSEYDLWEAQKDSDIKTGLSWVLRNNHWQALPAIRECVGARTPFGMNIDKMRFPENLPSVVGPYEALMQDPIDCGLITRTDLEGKWICGLYWEGTSHVTNHHPADCLHAIVNIGNIPAYSKRIIRGKIYWFKGSKEDLLKKWQKDFP